MTTIEINTKVTAPVTDAEGETTYVFGKLVALNSRWATIETSDGQTIKVGKTKIEAVEEPKAKTKRSKSAKPKAKTEYTEEDTCPCCGEVLGQGLNVHGTFSGSGKVIADDIEEGHTHLYGCAHCGEEFGPAFGGPMMLDQSKYDYERVTAASGKSSLDNGDDVALLLRGQTLETAYEITAKKTGLSIDALLAKYGHLNNGHQRMCLGNFLRRNMI